jgi:cytochrome c
MNRIALVVLSLTVAACGQPSAPQSVPAADMTAPAAATATPTPAPQARTKEEIAAIVATLPAPYNQGDYDNGKRMFAQCRSCHTVDNGGANRVGPHLHGVFGRTAGSVAEFNGYSAALKASGIVWDAAKIDAWTANPREIVATTNMVFPGIHKPEDRRDLIAFLKVESSD